MNDTAGGVLTVGGVEDGWLRGGQALEGSLRSDWDFPGGGLLSSLGACSGGRLVPFRISAFVFSGYIPKSGIAGSHDSCFLVF